MRFTPKDELDNRVARLQTLLGEYGLDGALIVQNADLFYFTGTVQRAHLFVPAAGEPVLAVTRSYERAAAESALADVVPLANPKELPGLLAARGFPAGGRLGLELDVLPAANYFRYEKLLAPARLADASPLIREVRMVKSRYELDIMREAGARHAEIFALLPALIRAGMSEVEMAGAMEHEMRRRGHAGRQRMRAFNNEVTHVFLASGANGAVASYFDGAVGGAGVSPAYAQGAGFKKLAAGEPILIDPAFVFDGYSVDVTRTFCMGELPARLAAAYDAARAIHDALAAAARPGVTGADLWALARGMADESGFGGNFMGAVSFVGHGIGIEIDELPVIAPGQATPLAEGMAICLEPKFVFPEGAVGLENTFAVTATGLERLMVFDEGVIYV